MSKGRRLSLAVLPVLFALSVFLLSACGNADQPTPSSVSTETTAVAQRDVSVDRDVVYGSNTNIDGQVVTLKMDIYRPAQSSGVERPLIILLPGGGFAPSTSKDGYRFFAARLASHGYVVACADYRVSDGRPETADLIRVLIVQGMQDAKAAVRFFREDATKGNKYGIDTRRVFLGGFSAGAFVTGHAVYLDNVNKADLKMRAIIWAAGGLEGDSGHPGYDSSVVGWINMAGGLIDRNYITAKSKPMLSIYGTADEIVSPGRARFLGTDLMVSGGRDLFRRAVSVGIAKCATYPIKNGNHVSPQDGNNETVARIASFVNSFN